MKVLIKINSIERLQESIDDDIKEGYVHFLIGCDVEGKSFPLKKRLRLDKSEKMLMKFLSKLPVLLEEQYKEIRYYVADKRPPEDLSIEVVNILVVEEKMYLMLEEVESFVRTGRHDVLVTEKISF